MVGDSTALDTVPLPAHTLVREELFMVYLIMPRPPTSPQRVPPARARGGRPARVLRSPGEISPTGCSYSVKIAARNLARALTILNGTRLPYLGIYVNAAGYGYREVEL